MLVSRVHQHHCAIAGVEVTSASTAHAFPRHSHDQYGLGVIHDGGQRSHSALGMVEAGPGDAIMVNPGEVHDGLPIDETGRSWRMLYFDPDVLTSAADDWGRLGAGEIELTRPVVWDRRLTQLFGQLFTVATSTSSSTPPLARGEMCVMLLTHLLHHHATARPARTLPGLIARARARIDDDPAANISLADLAAAAELSKFQVLRGFSAELELTPHAYLIQRRIMLSRKLIDSGAGLAETARSSGFADQSHMTRAFARHLGVTPGSYAAAVRGTVRRSAISFKNGLSLPG